MNAFKNIYIILLCIIMPLILKAQWTVYGKLSIGYGLLAGVLLIYSKSKKNQLDLISEKLDKKLDEVDDYLDKGKGIIEISDKFEKNEGIPAILTVKSILHTIQESIKKNVLPYSHALDRKAPSDIGVMKLLEQLLSDFDKKTSFDISERLTTLDEFRNVLYFKENVLFNIEIDGKEPRKGFGILLLTFHEILFIPMKWEFMKNMNKGKLFELLHKTTASMPFLNVGIATSELLLAFHEESKPEEVYFNEERKIKMENNYRNNEGWNIPFTQMSEFIFPYRMKGLKGVDQSLSIKTPQGIYKIWQAENLDEFRIELLEQLLLSNLLYRQLFYPIYEKHEGYSVKCQLVPSTEIDYEDPRMIEFRNNEIKNNKT